MYSYHFGRGWARLLPYLGVLPALLLYTIFNVGPSIFTAIFSFTNISGIPNVPWHFVGLDNYSEFFNSGGGGRDNVAPLLRTIIFCIAVTIFQNVVGLFLAVILNTRLKGHLFFRALFFMPVVLGVTVIGLVWNLVFYPLDGPAEMVWGIFGKNSNFLGDRNFAFILVIFVHIWSAVGWSLIIFMAGLQTISKELYEAARIDGASPWQSFRFITYRLLAPTITINVLLTLIGSLQVYQIIYVLTGGQYETSVLALQIFQIAFSGASSATTAGAPARQGYAASLSMIQFVLILVITIIAQFYLRRREEQI